MEEQKVTVDGVTHPVPQPFMVIATQNPIEQLGTYRSCRKRRWTVSSSKPPSAIQATT